MQRAPVTANDRLAMAVFLAAAVHLLVILGIGFHAEVSRQEMPPLIEITLAERPADRTPEDYDFLAQADQDGGGLAEDVQRPQRQMRIPAAGVPEADYALESNFSPAPPPHPAEQPDVATTDKGSHRVAPAEHASPDSPRPALELHVLPAAAQTARREAPTVAHDDGVPRFPSKQRIDARTRSHAAAAYMHEWIGKVERVGNLNYPEQARQRQLTGRVILEVTLRPDGILHDVRVLRGSGEPVLDQAAMRIVELAAPYAAVPPETLGGHDLLVIVRTWEFLADQRVHAR